MGSIDGYVFTTRYLQKILALWWAELLWILLSGVFRFWCPTSARKLLWSHLFGGWHGGTDIGHAVYHGTTLYNFMQELLDQTSRDFDGAQQCQLVSVLLRYLDLFPVPGSTLTSHTDAVEHEIDMGHSTPMRCAPRRMSSQKIKKEEECVTDMLPGGQIESSDSPWSEPVVLVLIQSYAIWTLQRSGHV